MVHGSRLDNFTTGNAFDRGLVMEVDENYQMTKAKQHYACRPLVARIAELEAQLSKYYRENIKLESDVMNSLDHLDIVCKQYEAKIKDQKVAFEAQLKTAKAAKIPFAARHIRAAVKSNLHYRWGTKESAIQEIFEDLLSYADLLDANSLTGEE